MNCIPGDDAHTEKCIKGINPCDRDHRTCIITGAEGENPDDCTTHENEDYADTTPHNEQPISSDPEPCCKYGPPLPGDTCDHCGFERPAAEPLPEPVTTSHTFIVDVKEFRATLELAVCEKKTIIPVLSTVLLSPQDSSLRVVSTDLDKWTLTMFRQWFKMGLVTSLFRTGKLLSY